jgi:ABC-2 type transport system permease protein
MNAHVRSEVLKLTTLRLPWVVATVSVLFSAGMGWAVMTLPPRERPVDLAAVAATPHGMLWFLVTVVAVLIGAGEFQHRTVHTTLLACPRRRTVLVTKAAVAAAYGVGTMLVSVTATVLSGTVTAQVRDIELPHGPPASWAGVVVTVLVGGVWSVLACGLGLLTRSTALALTTLLMWHFVLEGALPPLIRQPELAHWTPGGVAQTLVSPPPDDARILLSVLVLVGYVAALCSLAAVDFIRRDPA